ncbi:hypothetical protein ABW20_dc0107437 [Dactylellina cionopaga]|nr:hypothetical protein ABW20_dc0107437 [Dactylellina cionopaga]
MTQCWREMWTADAWNRHVEATKYMSVDMHVQTVAELVNTVPIVPFCYTPTGGLQATSSTTYDLVVDMTPHDNMVVHGGGAGCSAAIKMRHEEGRKNNQIVLRVSNLDVVRNTEPFDWLSVLRATQIFIISSNFNPHQLFPHQVQIRRQFINLHGRVTYTRLENAPTVTGLPSLLCHQCDTSILLVVLTSSSFPPPSSSHICLPPITAFSTFMPSILYI